MFPITEILRQENVPACYAAFLGCGYANDNDRWAYAL